MRGIEVIDLRGRFRWKLLANCEIDSDEGGGCDSLSGGFTWQPPPTGDARKERKRDLVAHSS